MIVGRSSRVRRAAFLTSFFPGLAPLDKARLESDIIAGITLAALGIPEVMGYAKIIGTPVITGLYTLFLPVLLFAMFGLRSILLLMQILRPRP